MKKRVAFAVNERNVSCFKDYFLAIRLSLLSFSALPCTPIY